MRQGSNAEFELIDERSVAGRPKSLDYVQATSMPLTDITVCEALVEKLQSKEGEKEALLIIKGAGGTSTRREAKRLAFSFSTNELQASASRSETYSFSKSKSATNVDHLQDLPSQNRRSQAQRSTKIHLHNPQHRLLPRGLRRPLCPFRKSLLDCAG